jgi:hypothetical protein
MERVGIVGVGLRAEHHAARREWRDRRPIGLLAHQAGQPG